MEVVDEFEFTAEAEQLASSAATLMLYQLILGRDPENSHVIDETKTQPIGAIFRSFIHSAEFSEFVLSPLRNKARLRHELTSPGPSVGQREWLASLLVLSPTQRGAIVAAFSWKGFFCALLGLPSDDAADDAPRQIADKPVDSPAALAESSPAVAASKPSMMLEALAEISAIELRLQHLKALLQEIGDGVSH